MTDRLDALIAMIAQNIQTDNDDCVEEINRIGRARAEYLQDFVRRLDGLRHVAADELKRVQHFLPTPSHQVPKQDPTPRIVHKGPAINS
jgi:hypothetical protein